MRRIVTAITAAAMALSLVAQAAPANALTSGFAAEFVQESAFVDLKPGETNTFSVTFKNIGTTTWALGTATQVDLAVCLEDKVTCNTSDAGEADYNDGWLGAGRYATQTLTSVAPGDATSFIYKVKVPTTATPGVHHFNGDLVLSTTGDRINPLGYFQDVTVLAAPAASCTPTAITTSPTAANRQVGTTHTQTATADCDAPTGSTTRPKAANAAITFVVDAPVGSLNADLTLTATTNTDGIATVTWSRTNPDNDNVATYPTAQPAVRATGVVRWTAAAAPLTITPDEAATINNTACKAFTVKTQNITTGAAASQKILLNFTQNSPGTTVGAATTNKDFGAFFKIPSNGVASASPTASTYNAILTTNSTGDGTFDVCGAGTDGTVTPVGYIDEDSDNTRDAGEDISDTGGAVTLQGVRAVITITPTTATSASTGGQVVYQVTAVDQYGVAVTAALDVSFVETTDDSTTTTTAAVISWTDNDTSLSTTASSGCATASSGTTAQNLGRVQIIPTSAGKFNFAVCDATAETATPIVWQDVTSDDNVRQTAEPQASGGAVTWATAAATTAKLSPSSATNTASSETTSGNNSSIGEERYTAQVTDQSGNAVIPSTTATTTVVFTVKNTSSTGNIFMTECQTGSADGTTGADATASVTLITGAIAPGATATCTGTIAANTTQLTSVEIDKSAAGNATVDCTMTVNTTTPSTYVCTQATKTWVDSGTYGSVTRGSPASATGNVVALDKTLDTYTITTTVGNFTIEYFPTETYTVDGSTATIAQFETNLTIGDKVTFTQAPAAPTPNHALVNQ